MTSKERERLVLQFIVQSFIDTGLPVGSRFLAKTLPVEWSAATVRNIMSDLEEQGFLSHPHTSAGRIPTDKAYRSYVNAMIKLEKPSEVEKKSISTAVLEIAENLSRVLDGMDEVLYHSSKALARITNELGIILSPRFNQAIFDGIKLIALSSEKILIELKLKSGTIKTLTLEFRDNISREHLHTIESLINERLYGLSVEEIRVSINERLRDLRNRFEDHEEAFVKVFLNSADSLFNFESGRAFNFAGANNILSKPDFSNSSDVSAVLELLEEKDSMIKLLTSQSQKEGVSVSIGEELGHRSMFNYSLIVANYHIGDSVGTVGIIGPKRMRYARLIPLAEHTAKVLDNVFNIGV